jgi:hypothetical protein
MASLVVVSPPTDEPVTLTEAKQHLRVGTTANPVTEDDAYITDCITAARQYAEVFLNRALLTTTYRLRLDFFPDVNNAIERFFVPTYSIESYISRAIALMSGPIFLPRPPTTKVVSVTYLDVNGVTQTMNPATDYVTDLDAEPARVAPAYGKAWPVTYAIQGAINVTFQAGFGPDASTVPLPVKQAIKMLISHFYEMREPTTSGNVEKVPLSAEALLWHYRVLEIA